LAESIELQDLHYAQRERLAFIDYCLQYLGKVSRNSIVEHFNVGVASCSRDLTIYRKLAPNNLLLKHSDKYYHRTKQFTPLFEHEAKAILFNLSSGFGDGISSPQKPSDFCIDAVNLINPESEVIAVMTRAINNSLAIKCKYVSLTSGETERVIVPHTIANNGQRWHVRAFDRKHKDFRDFVFTRLIEIQEIDKLIPKPELCESDNQWNKILTLAITPHPSVTHPKAIELDYAMSAGKLTLNIREALVGYLMRQWNVDCSEHASLKGDEYHLWLSNIKDLQGISSMHIAPGYKES